MPKHIFSFIVCVLNHYFRGLSKYSSKPPSSTRVTATSNCNHCFFWDFRVLNDSEYETKTFLITKSWTDHGMIFEKAIQRKLNLDSNLELVIFGSRVFCSAVSDTGMIETALIPAPPLVQKISSPYSSYLEDPSQLIS